MSEPLTSDDRAASVERLRSAGCVFPEEEVAILADAAGSRDELDAMVARRADGVPVEQIVGWAEFCGLRVVVEPGVFVPRRRTEQLATTAAAHASPDSVVVDLCCGSGAVGLVVATMVPGVRLHAVDIDPAAVRCARRNLAVVGGHVYEGDLFRPLSVGLIGTVDVLTVNAPYVPTGQIPLLPPEARDHEPAVALDGGADGLDVHRRVAAGVAMWLAPGGKLFAECHRTQAPTLGEIYAAAGGSVELVADDETQTTIVMLTASR